MTTSGRTSLMSAVLCHVQELESLLDDERRAADDLRNQLSVSERKRVALGQELEDARSLLEAVSNRPGSTTLARDADDNSRVSKQLPIFFVSSLPNAFLT